MKDAVFNPAEWDATGAEKVKKTPSPAFGVSAQQAAILAVVEAVEASDIDITANYSDWLAIGSPWCRSWVRTGVSCSTA